VAVRISDITIKNGNRGLFCYSSSVIIIRSIIEQNIGECGICLADNSTVNLQETIIRDNNSTGIGAFRNSSLWLENSQVYSNSFDGIDIAYNSSASINQSVIKDNGETGVLAVGGSSIRMYESEISNNKGSGVGVTEGASVALRGGNKIFENSSIVSWKGGINAAHGSTITLTDSPSSGYNEVYGNNGPGIFLGNSSNLFVQSAKIYGNDGDGIGLQFDSSVQFGGLEKTYLTITDNSGYGLSCESEYWHDSKYSLGPGVIADFSKNSSGFTNCYNYNSP
jgi:hypothetical protein